MRSGAPLLITGSTGTLGKAFARVCELRGLAYKLTCRGDLDIADDQSIERELNAVEPWAVVNTAGWVRVDDAESDSEACFRANATGPEKLAVATAYRGIPLVTFSSDLVFDGTKGSPYVESDLPSPLNVYGKSKSLAEHLTLKAQPGALVIRTSAFFGPWDEHNWVTSSLCALRAGKPAILPDDETISATYVPHLAHATLDLLIDGATGIWHLSNAGETTWLELVRGASEASGISTRFLQGAPTESFGFRAPRPRFSALGTERGQVLPKLMDALQQYALECN